MSISVQHLRNELEKAKFQPEKIARLFINANDIVKMAYIQAYST